ncbi:MAG: hypothetical protein KAT11_01090 [Phycisphaerae bacterium]|nr:hypothetical protein [Phycisphaerae bacterium]
MAKRRTIRKKASPSGKTRHDSEIRRAKRAVSAASTHSPSASLAPEPQPAASTAPAPPAELVPGLMKRLLRAAASPFVIDVEAEPSPSAPTEKLDLSFSANPLADLARRHVRQPRQFLPDPPGSIDTHCDQLLTSLANARIQAALQNSPDHNHPLSASAVSNGF